MKNFISTEVAFQDLGGGVGGVSFNPLGQGVGQKHLARASLIKDNHLVPLQQK